MTCVDQTSGCGCHLSGGNCISITGDGSSGNPYQIAPIIDPSGSNALSCGASGLLAVNAVPAGAMILWPSNVIPAGWLVCQGQAVSRTTYAGIFAVVGTTYGVGDGVTTFNLPNLQGRVPVGVSTSDSSFYLSVTGGEKTHTLITAEMPSHIHSYPNASTAGGGANIVEGSPNVATGNNMNATGGGGAHNNLQPYLSVNYLIKT
jgi:microcystin-dependent protein